MAGILFGLATITRGEAIYYLPIITLLALLPVPGDDKEPDTGKTIILPRITSLFVLFIAWGIVILPWYIRNQIVIGPGAGLGTSGGIMCYYGHHDETQAWEQLLSVENLGSGEIVRSKNALQKGLDYIIRTPIGTQIID